MTNFDKFIHITAWALNRYYGKEEYKDALVIDRGGIESKYRKIETLAWQRYITHADALK